MNQPMSESRAVTAAPWVFAGAIGAVHGDPQAGEEVAFHSHEGEFIARGLF